MGNLLKVNNAIINMQDQNTAETIKKFFKTGKGSYSENDVFLGIKVPDLRALQKKLPLNLEETQALLKSKFHEERFFSLINLIDLYEKANSKEKAFIAEEVYLKNTKHINNWDLTDVSAPKITGHYFLFENYKNRDNLKKIAKSKYLFDRRISIVSTLYFIKHNHLEFPLEISKILLDDSEDLINKAVGWVLREIGKKDENKLKSFIKTNYNKLKRVTLRYAIEKFDQKTRNEFLKGIF
ncbi:MAG: DNA alkylation repair protein [Desulfobacteraceae bacterium]|nr:DNA alkylation repair protein [Desulfobacteraceae bacterium]